MAFDPFQQEFIPTGEHAPASFDMPITESDITPMAVNSLQQEIYSHFEVEHEIAEIFAHELDLEQLRRDYGWSDEE